MAMDFPNSPTVNQTYTVGDKTWKWSGTVWEIVVNRPAMRSVADTPPASPIVGDEWFNSLTGKTYTWFDSYWIEVNTNSVTGASGLNGVASASAPLSYNSTNNNISVQNSPTFIDGVNTNASGDGQVLKLKARTSDGFNQIAWYKADASNILGLWQVNADTSVNFVRNTTPSGTAMNFQNSISINAAGHITLPAQPIISGSLTYTGGTSGSANYFYALTNVGFTIGAERITVPTAGTYLVTFNVLMNNTTGRRDAVIWFNGINQVSTLSEDNGTGFHYRSASVVRTLAANDFIQFSATDWYSNTSTGYNEWRTFSITKLS